MDYEDLDFFLQLEGVVISKPGVIQLDMLVPARSMKRLADTPIQPKCSTPKPGTGIFGFFSRLDFELCFLLELPASVEDIKCFMQAIEPLERASKQTSLLLFNTGSP